jgi:N-acetylneuraminate synthase/N,N'-diacetyllegionaminate synthase
LGINHNGDVAIAIQMVRQAAQAGAHAIKLQHYRTEDFLSDTKQTYTYQSNGRTVTESQHAMFERCRLSLQELDAVRQECKRCGIAFSATPSSIVCAQELIDGGIDFFKNASDSIDNLELLRFMAASQIPTVISTGMATKEDIDRAVKTFAGAQGRCLALLHCIAQYPAPVNELNLKKIPTLLSTYAIPVGFSDHSVGTMAAMLATALGAMLIEKHFTLDTAMEGPDHGFSSTPAQLKEVVDATADCSKALGNGSFALTDFENAARKNYRLSCVAATDIEKGVVLRRDHIALARPGTGMAAWKKDELVGKIASHNIPKGNQFCHESVH